jgi:ATP-dependent exoDNAse (exonuclease V) beta subunit
MMFQHDFLDLPSINNEDTDNGRFYVTPDGNRYPSVTTFLSKFSDSSWLAAWKERVGEDQANRTSTQSKRRGTAVHAILEQVVLNNPKFARGHMPNNLAMANDMANILRARAGIIKGVEIGLWSDKLMLAGRADCLGEFDNILSIIDFKTAKYNKSEEDIEGYFLQTTIYAMMVEELTGLTVSQIAILIGVDFEKTQVFVKEKDQFVPKILEMVASI